MSDAIEKVEQAIQVMGQQATDQMTLEIDRQMMSTVRRPASSFSGTELRRLMEEGLLRGSLVALEETYRRLLDDNARLLAWNARLACQLEATTQVARQQADRIDALQEAGWDVLSTLELYWKGERPIPEWHPTGALRRVLEENA